MLRIGALEIRRGEALGLVGPNGSGKTTLLRILAFLDVPASGRLFFDGREMHPGPGNGAGEMTAARRRATLLLQEPYLLRRSVFENVAYGLKARGKRKGLAEAVNAALDAVGLPPASFASRLWFELSGGEKSRVALAARLAVQPEALLLDEPSANLDAESALAVRDAAAAARSSLGATLVVAGHHHEWMKGLCDRFVDLSALSDGRESR